MKMLRSRLYEYELEKKKAITKKLEDSKLEINFGSQIRSMCCSRTALPRTIGPRSRWAMWTRCWMAIWSRFCAEFEFWSTRIRPYFDWNKAEKTKFVESEADAANDLRAAADGNGL
jgi:hypothetical protein